MIFSTPLFIFGFLPAVLVVYFLAPPRFRNHVALAFSFFFYAWGAPQFIGLVFLSCLIDWLLTAALHDSHDLKRRKRFLTIAVAQNLMLLGYFKYVDFSIISANSAMALFGVEPIPLLNVALPIGISFIVFEKITYIVDVYRNEGRPAHSFLTYLLYVHYFPQLIAGPIIKYHDIELQFAEREYSLDNVVIGMSRFSVGLAKKVLLADSLALTADRAFALPASQLDPATAWLGITCYTLQIYFDFSGYSDMAIGMARAMGFRFLENFNHPYISQNISEFWRRWHISFATWIRSYLYIPLGGNRISPVRTYVNLWLCFLLSGLWHGAAWTFVAWGCYHGIFLVIDRLFLTDLQKRLPRTVNIATCFFLTVIGWVIFRAEDMTQVGFYIPALFRNGATLPSEIHMDLELALYLGIGLLISFAPATSLYTRFMEAYHHHRFRDEISTLLAILLFMLSVGRIAGASFSPFLYFRF